ncbi:hypothetical protein MJT46_008429 [Ovis ammon polii x Ovis aries]|nr:hypothetical protein MJT46_008429 [Ovis ammon polii x Ovis aries]
MERKRGRPAPQKPPRTHGRAQSQAATELSTPGSDPEPREPLPLRHQEDLEPSTAEHREAVAPGELSSRTCGIALDNGSGSPREACGPFREGTERAQSQAATELSTPGSDPEPREPLPLRHQEDLEPSTAEHREAVAPGELSSRTCGIALDNGSGSPREACGPFREGTERAQSQAATELSTPGSDPEPREPLPLRHQEDLEPSTAEHREAVAPGELSSRTCGIALDNGSGSPREACGPFREGTERAQSQAATELSTPGSDPEPREPLPLRHQEDLEPSTAEHREAVAPGELSSRTCGIALDNGSGSPREACGPFREGTERAQSQAATELSTPGSDPEPREPLPLRHQEDLEPSTAEHREAVAPGELSSRTCGIALDNGSGSPREACGPFREGTERAQSQAATELSTPGSDPEPREPLPLRHQEDLEPSTAEHREAVAPGELSSRTCGIALDNGSGSPREACGPFREGTERAQSQAATELSTPGSDPEPREPLPLRHQEDLEPSTAEHREAVAPGELSSRTCGIALDNGSGSPREACGPFREGTEK